MSMRLVTAVTVAFAAIFLALSFYAFYPGPVTYDSIVQYGQSITGNYVDIFPPLMALTWRVLNKLHKGPALMSVLNLTLYWSAFAVLAIYCLKATGKWWSALSLTAGLFPFLLAFSGVVWKDVLLAGSWGLACALLLLTTVVSDRPLFKRLAWAAAAVLVVYGDAMRHNAAPAAIVLAGALTMQTAIGSVGRKMLVFFALAIPLAVAVPLISHLVDAEDGWGIEMVMSWDLTGISYFSGKNYRTGGVRPDSVSNLNCYSPRLADSCELVPFENRIEAFTRWRTAIAEQPLGYLQHRALMFSMLLRAGCNRCKPYTWVDHSDTNPYGFQFKSNALHQALGKVVKRMERSPLGRPYVWLVAASGLALMMWRRRHLPAASCIALLAASGVAYTLPYAVVAPTDEFRYLYWLFFCVVMVIAAIVFGSRDAGRFRALAVWVVLPVLLAGVTETFVRHHWPTDDIAPSMTTNY